MAKRTIEVVIDDLTGQPIPEGEGKTVTLMVNDRSTQVDLSDENLKRLETFLAPYFAKDAASSNGQPAVQEPKRTTLPTQKTQANREALETIRKWARGRGMKVSDRGRIPFAVMDAYLRAHPATSSV